MPKKVRTAKGKIIDFDLLKIKEQMVDAPKPSNVQARQDFIDQKMRRRVKKVKDALAEAKKNPTVKPEKDKGIVDVNNDLEVKSVEQGPKIDEAKPAVKPKRKIKKKQIKKGKK